jgi:hypothetical protein
MGLFWRPEQVGSHDVCDQWPLVRLHEYSRGRGTECVVEKTLNLSQLNPLGIGQHPVRPPADWLHSNGVAYARVIEVSLRRRY